MQMTQEKKYSDHSKGRDTTFFTRKSKGTNTKVTFNFIDFTETEAEGSHLLVPH